MACHPFWIWDLQTISYPRSFPMKSWRCWTNWYSSWVMQLGGSVARNVAYWHIWNQRVREVVGACLMKTWAVTCASEQWKFACQNPAISWISFTNVRHPGCYIGNLVEEDLRDVQQWIGRPNLNNFLDWSIGVIGKKWLQMLTGGWWRQTSLSNFVQNGRIRFTGCLYLPTFRPGSRPKVGCLFGMLPVWFAS